MKIFKALILLIIITSCGSRKVEKSIDKLEQKDVITTNTTLTADTDIRRYIYTTTDDFEIIPYDSSKPMVVNGKTFVNAKIKRLNKQITDTSKIASKVENKALEVKKTNKKEIKKEIRIDRSTYWGVLVAISLLLILLFLWQSLKKGILV